MNPAAHSTGCILAGNGVVLRTLGIACFLILHCSWLSAAPARQYGARLWQTDDGLPQNNVRAVAQSEDGYLWIATTGNLARFDGVRFRSISDLSAGVFPGSTAGLSIFTLAKGRDGSLWVGSNQGLFHLRDGQAVRYTEADGLACNAVRAILTTGSGATWIGTTNGLSRFENEKWTTFTMQDGLSQDAIRALAEDRHGNIWISGDVALHCFRNGSLVEQPIPRSLAYGAVRAICEDRTGALWVGMNSGLLRLQDGVFTRFTQEDGLLDSVVSVIYEDRGGGLWIGTYGGLNRMENGKLVSGVDVGDVPQDVIHFITEDHDGSIWLGCKDGLRQLNLRRFTSYTKAHGLTNNNVVSIREDRTEDILWIGTWSGGLGLLQNGQITSIRCKPAGPPPFILALYQDAEKHLWMGADFEGGLFRWKDGKLARFPAAGTIRVIQEDQRGNLWVGTSSGLGLFRDGKFTSNAIVEDLAGHTIRVIYEDLKGVLWVGSNRGLSCWREGKLHTFTAKDGLPINEIAAIHQDADGSLWVGTVGGGLCRVKQTNPGAGEIHVARFTTQEGFYSNDVFEILEDDKGFLWMSCLTGVFRAQKANLADFANGKTSIITNSVFGKRDGLASLECNSVAKPGACKSRDGRLWFATSQGVSVVDPNATLELPGKPPPVVIEEVIADKRVVSLGQHDWLKAEQPQQALPNVDIPPGRGDLEIHYTALSFVYPEKIRFKYKLSGIDPDWVEAETRRLATYNHLRPGNYHFQVIASDAHGVWRSSGPGLKLHLQPHFWQTWWFAASCGAIALGTIVAGVRYVSVRRLQMTLSHLEKQHAVERERARIAQDMHDDLGARLTEILLVSDFAQNTRSASDEIKGHVRKISRSAREVIDNLDAIVWAVNPENDTLDMFVAYVCEYAEMFVSMSNIRCRLDVPERLPAAPLSSETRHHLFMSIKEALNNVVKYSEASEIRLAFRVDQSTLTLDLEDNGRGFSAQDVQRTSNGLRHMEIRLRNIGGSCAISSTPGNGARIRFQIQLQS